MNSRDILQLRAFHAFYKSSSDLPANERFVRAIVMTSDKVFDRICKDGRIQIWQKQYLKKGKDAKKVPNNIC